MITFCSCGCALSTEDVALAEAGHCPSCGRARVESSPFQLRAVEVPNLGEEEEAYKLLRELEAADARKKQMTTLPRILNKTNAPNAAIARSSHVARSSRPSVIETLAE